MKLVIAIVQDEDINFLMDKLRKSGLRVTKLSSTGGFLRKGNTTIIIGVEEHKVESVISIIKEECREREVMTSTPPMVEEASLMLESFKVKVGGATVFILDVDQFIKV